MIESNFEVKKMEVNNYVLICNKVDSLVQKQLIKMEVDTFNATVDEFAGKISQQLSLDKNAFDIICFGRTLESSKSLDSYGINNGIILYLTKRKEIALQAAQGSATSTQPSPADEAYSTKSQQMCIALKSALLDPRFRKVLEKVADFENRENIMAVNPELRNDPSLFGILSDPDLLSTYINRNNIKKVLERYPYFLEVATHISATFHEDSRSGNSFNLESLDRSSFLNYSIDASDDEMDDSEASSISSNNTQQSAASSSRQAEHSAQSAFSSMLMRAYQNRNQASQPASSNQITSDMLRTALSSSFMQPPPVSSQQQSSVPVNSSSVTTPPVAATAAPPAPQPPASQPSQQRTAAQILIERAPQLRQMRELGITDEIVAIQALEATNGDVQAAINIIFSDFN